MLSEVFDRGAGEDVDSSDVDFGGERSFGSGDIEQLGLVVVGYKSVRGDPLQDGVYITLQAVAVLHRVNRFAAYRSSFAPGERGIWLREFMKMMYKYGPLGYSRRDWKSNRPRQLVAER